MEMERINDDIIKVRIAPIDLEERGVNFLDLMGDHKRIEQFFYEILEEVDDAQTFRDSEQITFQVIPSDGGLELYISRNGASHIEELWERELLQKLLERKQKALEKKKVIQEEAIDSKETTEVLEEEGTAQIDATSEQQEDEWEDEIIQFHSLEDFLVLARQLPTDDIDASLYTMNGHYYLVLKDIKTDISEDEAFRQYLQMLEYGEEHRVRVPVLREYGQLLREGDALHYFGTLGV